MLPECLCNGGETLPCLVLHRTVAAAVSRVHVHSRRLHIHHAINATSVAALKSALTPGAIPPPSIQRSVNRHSALDRPRRMKTLVQLCMSAKQPAVYTLTTCLQASSHVPLLVQTRKGSCDAGSVGPKPFDITCVKRSSVGLYT